MGTVVVVVVVVVVIRTVCKTNVFVDKRQRMHLIMGAVSLWTRPPALYLCTGPQKKPTHRAKSAATETPNHTAPVVVHNGHATTSPEFKAATVGAQPSPPRLHSRTAGPHNRDIGHRVQQTWNVHGQTDSLDHGTCLCATTGKRTCSTCTTGTSITVHSNWGRSGP